ncbi:MAG: MBL fold metallo-hydrolase [Hyphomicrobiales bacterium]|nr:MBL fold metallo-hydrolase [Hyphomicrobiales bacterium]
MSLRVRILGCGSSGGVPRIGGDWGVCDPDEPRNRRRRCSILLERAGTHGKTTVLIDTSPDLRMQLLDADVTRLDAVVYTHDHADQTHGIDDLRALYLRNGEVMDAYMDGATRERLFTRFAYCFEKIEKSDYRPILKAHEIRADEKWDIQGAGGAVTLQAFDQIHGKIHSLGFRCGPVAYSSDVNALPEESFRALEGVDTWIVDALRHTPHPTHANVETALEWLGRIRPRRGILTNLHVDLDYAALARSLPEGVEPAYDGMELVFEGI